MVIKAVNKLRFPDCGPAPLGIYPLVERAAWLERLLPLGISTVQLRIKDLTGEALRAEIEAAVRLARQHDARLFVNDYWQLAIEAGAYGVHLGQEDLDDADLAAIHAAGLRLGVSTHSEAEIDRALGIRPSYIAIGPVFETQSKVLAYAPRGAQRLRQWVAAVDYPVVAIGGITADNLAEVLETGVGGVGVIGSIARAENPEAAVEDLQARFHAAVAGL